MKQEELNKIIKEHEKWLITNGEAGHFACLRGEDLQGMDLHGRDLSHANLSYANLSGADLREADLNNAVLHHTDFSCANLNYAGMRYADLRHANMCYAYIRHADLRHADMRYAKLQNAETYYADMKYADLLSADLDFSVFPLWCGGLDVNIDDRQATQLLYHLIRNVNYSKNCSESMKKLLNMDSLVNQANKFHRIDECGIIKEIR